MSVNPPTIASSNEDAGGIPCVVYFKRILQLCFYPVVTVMLGNLVILFVPQARETILAFDEDAIMRSTQAWAFIVAFLLWMLSAWYVSRLLLGKVFVPDLIGTCESQAFSVAINKHLPRCLALAAGLPIAGSLAFAGKPKGLGFILMFVSFAMFGLLVFRRDIGQKLKHGWVTRWQASDSFQSFSRLDRVGIAIIFASLLLSVVLFVLILVHMEEIARPLGSPAIVLFALASWTVFGGFVLTYWPKAHGLFAFTWLPLLLLLMFARSNDNHPVARGSSVTAAELATLPRPALGKLFTSWIDGRPDKQAPIIFVAAAGGASRAAYWTTSALGHLEDQARQESRRFSDNIFVISGISGGSVGASAFVTALDAVRSNPDKNGRCSSVRDVANDFTGQDHLSTVVGFMLYADLMQRFIPGRIDSLDRSRGLEEVWSRDWRRTLDLCGFTGTTNAWEEPFLSLFKRQGTRLPALALNTTALDHGWPVMQANFTLEQPTAFDLLSTDLATNGLTLAQAAHNSARFPYISPAGVVRRVKDNLIWDHVGDGGYLEASGTLILGEILRELMREQLICNRSDEYICPADDASCRKCVALRNQVRVLVLDNQPTAEIARPSTDEPVQDKAEDREIVGSWLCSAASGPARFERQHNLITAQKGAAILPRDLTAPITGAFGTRGGRAASSEIDLLRLVGGCAGVNFAELRLPLPPADQRKPSMNWMLNRASREQMTNILATPGHGTHLESNLAIVRSWMAAAPQQ